MEKFVVYGRLAKQLVPFLCLLTAAGAHEILGSHTWKPTRRATMTALLVAALVVQAATNFAGPLRLSFPDDFRRLHNVDSVGGFQELLWVNVKTEPLRDRIVWPDNSVVLARAIHPLAFLPYQYEGYSPAQRRALRSTDIDMRLVAVPK
jgi:hypothetical protein